MTQETPQEPIRLEFDLKSDTYLSQRTLYERRMPLFLIEGNAPLVSYWCWSESQHHRYVPRSSIQRHVDLGFLAESPLTAMRRALRDPNIFHDFNRIKRSAKVKKNGEIFVYVAEVTLQRVAEVQAQYLERGSINAYQFLFGLEIPDGKGRPTIKLREGMQTKLRMALVIEHSIKAVIRDNQPWYTPAQQAEILGILNATYTPRMTKPEGGDGGDSCFKVSIERKMSTIERER